MPTGVNHLEQPAKRIGLNPRCDPPFDQKVEALQKMLQLKWITVRGWSKSIEADGIRTKARGIHKNGISKMLTNIMLAFQYIVPRVSQQRYILEDIFWKRMLVDKSPLHQPDEVPEYTRPGILKTSACPNTRLALVWPSRYHHIHSIQVS